jgi:HSP20 family protein
VGITLERRVLTIRGRSAANDHAGYQRVYNEYADGDYERAFTLSENIDRDRIEATLKDGVLHLVLPKAETEESAKDRAQIRVTRSGSQADDPASEPLLLGFAR